MSLWDDAVDLLKACKCGHSDEEHERRHGKKDSDKKDKSVPFNSVSTESVIIEKSLWEESCDLLKSPPDGGHAGTVISTRALNRLEKLAKEEGKTTPQWTAYDPEKQKGKVFNVKKVEGKRKGFTSRVKDDAPTSRRQNLQREDERGRRKLDTLPPKKKKRRRKTKKRFTLRPLVIRPEDNRRKFSLEDKEPNKSGLPDWTGYIKKQNEDLRKYEANKRKRVKKKEVKKVTPPPTPSRGRRRGFIAKEWLPTGGFDFVGGRRER